MSEEEADGGTCAICGVGVRWGSRCNDHLVRHEPLSGPVYYPRVPYHGSGKETVLHTFTEKRLAEHDRQVRAEAWEEGWNVCNGSSNAADDSNPYRLAEAATGCLVCGTRPATHRFSVLSGPDGWLCEGHKDDPVVIGGRTYGSTGRRYDESE